MISDQYKKKAQSIAHMFVGFFCSLFNSVDCAHWSIDKQIIFEKLMLIDVHKNLYSKDHEITAKSVETFYTRKKDISARFLKELNNLIEKVREKEGHCVTFDELSTTISQYLRENHDLQVTNDYNEGFNLLEEKIIVFGEKFCAESSFRDEKNCQNLPESLQRTFTILESLKAVIVKDIGLDSAIIEYAQTRFQQAYQDLLSEAKTLGFENTQNVAKYFAEIVLVRNSEDVREDGLWFRFSFATIDQRREHCSISIDEPLFKKNIFDALVSRLKRCKLSFETIIAYDYVNLFEKSVLYEQFHSFNLNKAQK